MKRFRTAFCLVWALSMLLFQRTEVAAIDANLLYYFTHLDSRDGLSENSVKAIVQDHWGLIWLGTKNGLNRYDGRSLRHYDVDDLKTGRGNHNVSALFEDDRRRLWVGTDKGVFLFDFTSETFSSLDVVSQDGKQVRNWIAQIEADREGRIWIASPDEGVFRYDPSTETLRRYTTRGSSDDGSYNPQCFCLRPDGEVWIGTAGQGVFLLDEHTGHVRRVLGSLAGQHIYTMVNYGEWMLLGEHMGQLKKFNPKTKEMAVVDAPNVHYKIIRALNVDGDNIFVATQDGLYIVNEKKRTEQRIHENGLSPNCLSDNMICELYRDRDGGLWIGTMQSGVDYMPRAGLHFYSYVPLARANSLSNKHIREMQCDANGHIWIATEEGKINIFRPATQDFLTLNTPHYKGGTNRLALMVDGDMVWSGLFKNGLDIISVSTHDIMHYSPKDLGLHSEGSVYALFKDREGNVWLGTGAGLYIKSAGMRFNKVTVLPDIFVQDISQDRFGNIWVATIGSGIFRLEAKSWRQKQFQVKTGEIKSNDVSSISIDHSGCLWFGTDRGGLVSYDPAKGAFTTIGKDDGLPDDVTYKVLEDSLHRIWFGTNNGLVCRDPRTGRITVYYNNNGLPGNQYNYKSAVAGHDGTFYVGGTNGLIAFNPQLAGKDSLDRVLITNLRVDGKDVFPEQGGVLRVNIIEAGEIHLPYDFSNIQLSVSSLNYSGVESTNYEYQLSGIDKDWIPVHDKSDIGFSRLSPGKYTFRVRMVGGGPVTELVVDVAHPWYSSLPMKIVYFIMAVVAALLVYRFMQNRQKAKEKERTARFVEEKEKELLQSKINFFTNITHEIRTPLTLINGSVENIAEQHVANPVVQKNIGAIEKNTKRLLNLINQLLDFRKVNSNGITPNFTNINLGELVTGIVERFEPTINRMHKTISLDIKDDGIVLQADREAVTKILSNLLNNARKYSETFIQVTVAASGDRLTVRVVNDGQKIPAEKAGEIFKPFTQLDTTHTQSGSGLGLPMARSLAEMHNGTLELDTASEYNEFVLVLPLRQDHVIDIDGEAPQPQMSADPSLENYAEETHVSPGSTKGYTILVVEDNEEVMGMIADGLAPHYSVLTAKNGVQGLAKAHREHVDLVVSDVMMPEMDGLEMCRRLKEDIETSHIPVVMLTAKQTLDNRLDGLWAGADAYIEKPFSFVHLLTQVETLLLNRKRERESFVKKPYLPVQSSGISKVDEQFISRITELITKNIRSPEFNVEQLASEMCISRSSLHRKIKEVSDMTPIDFIRLIRLKKAAELIREKGYRANEVCEMVGINSPSYFIKLFQKQFGMTPKEFAQKKD